MHLICADELSFGEHMPLHRFQELRLRRAPEIGKRDTSA